jgi:chaperonin GroES
MIQPLDERVLIKPVQDELRIGLIIVPDVAKEKPQIGEIIAIGDDIEITNQNKRKLSEMFCIGDKVIYARYGGIEIKVDNNEYIIVSRNDILAVIK